MIRFKIDVIEQMKKNGYSSYVIEKNNLISKHTLYTNIRANKNITLETLNKVCIMCELPLDEIIEFVPDAEEMAKYKGFAKN